MLIIAPPRPVLALARGPKLKITKPVAPAVKSLPKMDSKGFEKNKNVRNMGRFNISDHLFVVW